MLATFAALVDEDLATWAGEDSFDQLPVILGETETPARQSMITQSYTGVLSVRSGPWKLILDTKGSGGHESATPGFQPLIQGGPWEFQAVRTGQLYDIQHDPYETTDLFEKRQDVVEELTQFLTKAVSDGRTRP
jgi:arylsulfatase A